MTHKVVKGAVLLAAGRGKRLRPYTDNTPKPLLPVNGRPTLDLYFQGLVEAGVEEAVFGLDHFPDHIHHYPAGVRSGGHTSEHPSREKTPYTVFFF